LEWKLGRSELFFEDVDAFLINEMILLLFSIFIRNYWKNTIVRGEVTQDITKAELIWGVEGVFCEKYDFFCIFKIIIYF